VSPFVAYLAGIGTVAAAIGVGFTGGIMLTGTDFIRKDHAQLASPPAQAGKAETAAKAQPAVTGAPVREAATASAPEQPQASAPPASTPSADAPPASGGAAAQRADDTSAAHESPHPPALQERRAADAEPGMLLTPARPAVADRAVAAPQRLVEPGKPAAETRKSKAAVRDRARKDTRPRRKPAEDGPAVETTGTVTREIIIEYGDDGDAERRVERPHGMLDLLGGR